MDSHWARVHDVYSLYGPPLRPAPEVAAAMARELGTRNGRVLLLGVTPDLASLGEELLAIDRNEAMVAGVWPGDSPRRRAQVGDWLDLPLEPASFDGAVGDGCLSALPSGAHGAFFRELARVLRPGGRLIVRLYCSPESAEAPARVCQEALAGLIPNPWAFRMRLFMALAASRPGRDLPVPLVLETFTRHLPDRDALEAATGWDRRAIDMIDLYKGSVEVYCLGTAADTLASVPTEFSGARFVATSGYPLAECCPLLVAERRT